jgi:hypothetical protein
MTKAEDAGQTPDPFEVWRQVYDANERAWSAALEEAMESPEFSESSGKLLETMLAAQKTIRDNMRTYLETMNVPTREDIARLGELVVGLEEKVDQVVDRLDLIEDAARDDRRTYAAAIKALNVPTREDIARVRELVVGLEKKIDRRHASEDKARARAAASAKAAAARAAAKAKAAADKAKAAAASAKAAGAAKSGPTSSSARAATASTTSAKAAQAKRPGRSGTK